MSDPIAVSRRLVAVFAADVEGYSRLMGTDEVGTLKALTERRAILDRLIGEHRGRIANTAGDSVLAEFGSAVDAVQCAVEAQTALAEANDSLAPDRRISFRIGIHIGDVMVRAGDLFGDGVNIAARLQTLATPGAVCISGATYDQVRKVLPMTYVDLGVELGVRYVLEGSVRKAGGKVRITGQLIEASTGAHLWADKIDGSLEDIFELQDRVTSSVVAAIAPKLDQAEIDRANRKPLLNLDAYDCILRGMDCASFVGDHEKNEEALRFFYRAIELDPQSASAYGWASSPYFVRKMNGWIVDNERDFAEARRLAECAIRLGQDDARALSQAAWVLSFCFLSTKTPRL